MPVAVAWPEKSVGDPMVIKFVLASARRGGIFSGDESGSKQVTVVELQKMASRSRLETLF